MRMCDDAPGSPLDDAISTPGAFAAIAFTRFGVGTRVSSSPLTDATDTPSRSRVVVWPMPVATIVSSCSTSVASWKFAVAV